MDTAPGSTDRELLEALAEVLSYPTERTPAATRTLLERDPDGSVQGALAPLVALGALDQGPVSRARVQETFTATFDLQPACAPYFGHHLLGEDSPLRGPLLAKLAEIYERHGFRPREELGDHVAEVLRFLAVAAPGAERDDLIRDGLLPALRRMTEALEGDARPFRGVLTLAERTVAALVPPAGAHAAPPLAVPACGSTVERRVVR